MWRNGLGSSTVRRVAACLAWLLAPLSSSGDQPPLDPSLSRPVSPDAVVTVEPLRSPVLVTGMEDPRLRSFDRLMLGAIRDEQVPGAALAVVKEGRLVYARGFGMRDVEQQLPVMPTSLFRIASISKPITAVAVMQLVERGDLDLDDRLFDILDVEPHRENGTDVLDERLERITIRHLLQHTAGWDRDASFDPMFQSVRIANSLGVPPPAQPLHVIQFMKGKPLDFDPGARYAYSNIGYCLLGRVIEAKTGLAYQDYVRRHVFAPLGSERPRLGATRTTGSFEVKYYDPAHDQGESVFADNLGAGVPQPYGAWCLEAMDSHGGWLASAVDLVRFSAAVHAGDAGGILRDTSVTRLFERPEGAAGYLDDGTPRDNYYGLGWQVRPVGRNGTFHSWHTGSLPGTWTLLVHRHDDCHWALLLNTRQDRSQKDNLMSRLDRQLHAAADAVADWPEEDLFPLYLSHPPGRIPGTKPGPPNSGFRGNHPPYRLRWLDLGRESDCG